MFTIIGEKLGAPHRHLQQRLSVHPPSGCPLGQSKEEMVVLVWHREVRFLTGWSSKL